MPETELLDTYLQVEAEWRKLPPVRDHDGITFKRSRFIDSWDVEVQPLVKEYLRGRTKVAQLFFKQKSGRTTEGWEMALATLVTDLAGGEEE